MAKWKLTVREGPNVNRRSFSELDEAIEAAGESAGEILDAPQLKPIKSLRNFDPVQLTKARIEISGKGLIKPPTAGLDIRGDNSILGYTGSVRRKAMDAEGIKPVLKQIRQALQHE